MTGASPSSKRSPATRIRAVRLEAAASTVAALADFYCERLGLEALERSASSLAVGVGGTLLDFRASAGGRDPFYHYALLAPRERFHAARDWLAERARLLPDPETGEPVFDFANWDAFACYCHDPAGNIVELIALDGVREAAANHGPFRADELLGIAEIGLVGPSTAAMAAILEREVGLGVWCGTIEEPGRLAFAGELGSTLILCPTGRGWLPTGRPAEVHPTEVVVAANRESDAQLAGLPHRVRTVRP
jgi:catechol 2,3-dioxygenase-like lactoylglutathione lyase family enzyme